MKKNDGRIGIWRRRAQESVDAVIAKFGTDNLDILEKVIRKQYPFGERANWPYKVWLSVVKETMNELRSGIGHPVTPNEVKHFWISNEMHEKLLNESLEKHANILETLSNE